ncbi:MAG: hypothetical protein ACHQHP_03685 [Bacteroidia bacterium]
MKYWIITILSLASFLAEGQTMDTLLAKKLLQKEILYFIASSDSEKFYVLLDKADLQKFNGKYENALAELERAEKFSSDGKRKIILQYERMLNYFLSNQFGQCASMEFAGEEVEKINKQQEYFLMKFFSLNETGQWSRCKEELLSYCSLCDSIEIRQLISLPVTYTYINPEQCRRLSSFIPGLGMVKAGKPFKAAVSLLLQAGFTFVAGYNFYAGYYAAGLASGVFPLLKLHKGGNRLSAILAEEQNEKEKQKLKILYSEAIKKIIHP